MYGQGKGESCSWQAAVGKFTNLQCSGSHWSRAFLWRAPLGRVPIGNERFEAGGAVRIVTHDDVVVGHHVNVGLYHAAVVVQWNYVNVAVNWTHLL